MGLIKPRAHRDDVESPAQTSHFQPDGQNMLGLVSQNVQGRVEKAAKPAQQRVKRSEPRALSTPWSFAWDESANKKESMASHSGKAGVEKPKENKKASGAA